MQVDERMWEPVWEPVLRTATGATVDFEYPKLKPNELIVFDNISIMSDTGAATDFVMFMRIGNMNHRLDLVTGVGTDVPRNYIGRVYADREHQLIVRAMNAAAGELLRCLFMGRRYITNDYESVKIKKK